MNLDVANFNMEFPNLTNIYPERFDRLRFKGLGLYVLELEHTLYVVCNVREETLGKAQSLTFQ